MDCNKGVADMVSVTQRLECWIMNPEVEGSSPFARTT